MSSSKKADANLIKKQSAIMHARALNKQTGNTDSKGGLAQSPMQKNNNLFGEVNFPVAVEYARFKYERNDWENVAPIVPRFLRHIEKHVTTLNDMTNEMYLRETTMKLREFTEYELAKNNEFLANQRFTDIEEKEKILQEVQNNLDKFNSFTQEINSYQQNLASLKTDGTLDYEKAMQTYMQITDRLKPHTWI